MKARLQASLEALAEYDPEKAAAVRGVLLLRDREYFALLGAEGLNPCTTRRQYVQHAIRATLVKSVRWQADALAAVRCSSVAAPTPQSQFFSHTWQRPVLWPPH